jgi:hypothetical protein
MSAHAGLQDDRLPNRCNPIPERWNAAAIGEPRDPSRLHQVGEIDAIRRLEEWRRAFSVIQNSPPFGRREACGHEHFAWLPIWAG